MMMINVILVFVSLLTIAGGEYVWNGSEWEWEEKQSSGEDLSNQSGRGLMDSDIDEGSGDDYDDEDYDEEDYGFNYDDKPEKPVASDDEDFIEGSGDSDHVKNIFDTETKHKVKDTIKGDYSDIYVENTDWKDDSINLENEDDYTHHNQDVYMENGTDEEDNYSEMDTESDYDLVQTENTGIDNEVPPKTIVPDILLTTPPSRTDPDVQKKVPTSRHPASFFAQPGILAAVIGGAVVGLLCAILLVMFIVYRMRKKDEGSYALDEPKRSHNSNSYSKAPSREFYA